MDQTGTANATQSTRARVAGAALFLGLAILLPVNYSTALQYHISDITAHLAQYRFNAAVDVFYVVDLLVVLGLFYAILKSVNRSIALVATCFRLLSAVAWAILALAMLNILQILDGPTQLSAFSANQLHALAHVQSAYATDAYYVGLPAWALASTLYSLLWLKSRYIPRALAVYGVLSSAWCVVCAFVYLAVPHFDQMLNADLYDVPMVLFELALGLWLWVAGLRVHHDAARSGRVIEGNRGETP